MIVTVSPDLPWEIINFSKSLPVTVTRHNTFMFYAYSAWLQDDRRIIGNMLGLNYKDGTEFAHY